jgi:hypothetical protein
MSNPNGIVYLNFKAWFGDSGEINNIRFDNGGIWGEIKPNDNSSLKKLDNVFIPYTSIKYLEIKN